MFKHYVNTNPVRGLRSLKLYSSFQCLKIRLVKYFSKLNYQGLVFVSGNTCQKPQFYLKLQTKIYVSIHINSYTQIKRERNLQLHRLVKKYGELSSWWPDNVNHWVCLISVPWVWWWWSGRVRCTPSCFGAALVSEGSRAHTRRWSRPCLSPTSWHPGTPSSWSSPSWSADSSRSRTLPTEYLKAKQYSYKYAVIHCVTWMFLKKRQLERYDVRQ